MSRLSDLYKAMETLRKEELPVNEDLERKASELEEDIIKKEILPDPEVEHKEIGKTGPKEVKNSVTRLRITFADGSVIQERNAAESFVVFVRRVGVERVRSLGLKQCKIPLVSNTLDKKYGDKQKSLGNGWYLMTNTSTQSKRKDIELIAKAFNINAKVDII